MGITVSREITKLPLYFDPKPTCPAGAPVCGGPRGSGVLCRVTDSVLASSDDPRALIAWCTGAYINCPVWREARDQEREGTLQKLREQMAKEANPDRAILAAEKTRRENRLDRRLVAGDLG
jgi:hypothetical protein